MSLKRPITDVWCVTDNDVRKVSFLWSINQFSHLQQKSGHYVKSAVFSDTADKEVQWMLKVFPNGNKADNKDYVSLFLDLVLDRESDRDEISAQFHWFIVDSNGEQTNRFDLNHVFKSDEMDWGFARFVSKATLFDPENGLLTDDCLTICCEVTYSEEPMNRSGRTLNPKRRKQSLCTDFSQLYDSMKDWDIILVVKDKEFKAHKLILKTRSSVFSAMFDVPMSESRNNRVVIKDMEKKVFEVMLKFIYTGNIDKQTLRMNKELLSAADKYDLEDLKKVCEDFIESQLTIESVSDVLVLADMHSAQSLKERAIEYITQRTSHVMKTKGWKAIRNPDLLNEVLTAFAQRDTDRN